MKAWVVVASLLLVAVPVGLSARHVVRQHALAQVPRPQAANPNCAFGATPPAGTSCSISDYTAGGALSGTDAVSICQVSGGCFASSPTITYKQVPLLSSVLGGFGGSAIVGGGLTINRNTTSALPPAIPNTGLWLNFADADVGPNILLDGHGGATNTPTLLFRNSASGASYGQTVSGTTLGTLAYRGFDTGYTPRVAALYLSALESFTPSAHGTQFRFDTNAVGTTSPIQQVLIGPGVTVGNPTAPSSAMVTGDLNVAGRIMQNGTAITGGTGGGGTVNSGTANQLAYYGATGTTISGLATGTANQVLTLNSSLVPTWTAPTGGAATTITLAPGLASAPGTYNTGTQTVTNGSTLSPQLFWEGHGTSYTVLAADSGKWLEATAAGVTFTLPAIGAVGSAGYQFAFNALNSYTVSSATTIYGCGPSGTSVTLFGDAVFVPGNSSQWKCSVNSEPKIFTVAWGPNMNMSTSPVPIATRGLGGVLNAMSCLVGVAAPSPATLDVCYAPDGTVPSAGCTGTGVVKLDSTACSAVTPVGTQQSLAAAFTAIPANQHIWVMGSGAGWATATTATGYIQLSLFP